MNKKCLLIFTIAISFEIFSEEVKITQEYLLNSEANISFEKNTFEISTGYGGWASGTYRIENNTIVIVPNNINYYGLEYLQNKEIHYKVIRQKNSIYTDSFVCIDNYKGIDPIKSFVNRSSRLPEGSLIKIKPDIEVILLEEYLAEVNDNVNIRDYPSLKGNKFIIEFRDSGDKPFKYLPNKVALFYQ